jgi:RimJ/RimL family protein N-acetyltransferase
MTGAAEPAKALEDIWPLFGLRLVTERLELRPVREADLAEVAVIIPGDAEPDPALPRFGLADPGDVRAASSFQSYWSSMGAWREDDWRVGFVARLRVAASFGPAGGAIGMSELEAHGWLERRTVETGSWLMEPARRQGFGKELRAAMLMLAFGGLGATVAETGALDDNLASIAVSRSFGYEPNGEETHDHEGTPARLVRFRLAREAWDTTVRPACCSGWTRPGRQRSRLSWAPRRGDAKLRRRQ